MLSFLDFLVVIIGEEEIRDIQDSPSSFSKENADDMYTYMHVSMHPYMRT